MHGYIAKITGNHNITSFVECLLLGSLSSSDFLDRQITQRVTSHCIMTFEKASYIPKIREVRLQTFSMFLQNHVFVLTLWPFYYNLFMLLCCRSCFV